MIKNLGAYSQNEIEQVRRASSAFDRYWTILQTTPHSEITKLKQQRHQSWCECTLATFFETATTELICRHWSQTADAILAQAWKMADLNSERASLFALGKLGSRELNLSSDVDLMIIAEPMDVDSVGKKLRTFRQIIHQADEDGFCFRIDFDLRPGGNMGPVVVTPSQFQDHYWSQGETWERLALVRMRFLTGNEELKQATLDLADRFSFRKFLDYSLLEDLKSLRAQIHQQGFVREPDETHLKLEVGGIRDIELFTHSLLVLNGGKHRELKIQSTGGALKALQTFRLISMEEAEFLETAYWRLRHFENQIQAVHDRQTHSLAWSKMPLGWNWPKQEDVTLFMNQVDKIVSGLLGKVDLSSPQLPADLALQAVWLKKLGYADEAITSTWDKLIKATALSHKSDRDERARRQFLFTFIEKMAALKQDHNLGLQLLCDFVKATRAKATFFSMLLREPRLMDDLARIFCTSPYMGAILAARPELLDNFILHRDEDWQSEISEFMEQACERKLLSELRSANYFLQKFDLEGLTSQISAMADDIGQELLQKVSLEAGTEQMQIVALGKWGSREMGLRSDLDFIFVSLSTPTEADFKAARRFVSRLTDPQRGGILYGMDLRLRPSGQSGAILVSQDQLEEYWKTKAQAWERQAYLRMRTLGNRLQLNKNYFLQRGLSSEELAELKNIKTQLLKPEVEGEIDLKYCRGGLIDIEFAIQTKVLLHQIQTPPHTLGMLDEFGALKNEALWSSKNCLILKKAYIFLRTLEQLLQLSASHSISQVKESSEVYVRACSLWQKTTSETQEELQFHISSVKRVLDEIDPTEFKR